MRFSGVGCEHDRPSRRIPMSAISIMRPQTRQTIFSPCRQYRYALWREWGVGSLGIFDHREAPDAYMLVIGLNPSTADETKDDPTIRRCIDFAKRQGFGALCMANLFAWRDTKPENMKKSQDPVGPLNDFHLFRLARDAGMILAAWGKHGSHQARSAHVRSLFQESGFPLKALRLNKDGSPEHPLYIPATTQPIDL